MAVTQQEELEELRQLVEKQKAELEKKDRIIANQNIQIDNMIQALLHARKRMFGASTEASKGMEGQLSLFESVQELAKDLGLAQKKITVKTYTRTPRQPGVREEMLSGLPQEVEEYVIPDDDRCSVCGGKLIPAGKRLLRTEVEFVPAKLIVKHIFQQVSKCSVCGTAAGKNPVCHFQKAAAPFPFDAVPACPDHVSEVWAWAAPGPAGKGLVPAGPGTPQKRYGPLDHPVQ